MKEVDRLMSMLFPEEGAALVDLKFFPGEQPVTMAEFCEEVHSAFLQVDSGTSLKTSRFEEKLTPVRLEKFLATA